MLGCWQGVTAIGAIIMLRQVGVVGEGPGDKTGYMDDPIRYGVILTTFWGVVGFLVGVVAALQLASQNSMLNPI